MKYIAKCVEQHYFKCGNKEFCLHAKPHEWRTSTSHCYNDHGNECDCIPVGLEYYMKEIIKKNEEDNE